MTTAADNARRLRRAGIDVGEPAPDLAHVMWLMAAALSDLHEALGPSPCVNRSTQHLALALDVLEGGSPT